ncbi:hypothetical protein RI054_02g09570 [Pseudoscourfieldia marina]
MATQKEANDNKNKLEFDGRTPELWVGYQAKFEARLRQTKRKGITKNRLRNYQFQPNSISGPSLYDAINDQPGGFGAQNEPFWTRRQLEDQRQLFDAILMTQTTSSPLIIQLSGYSEYDDCGKQAWNFLLKMFRSRMEESTGLKVSQLTHITQDETETLDEYAQRAITMISELKQLGKPQDDASVVNHVLTGLREEFNTIRGVWRMTIASRRRSDEYENADGIKSGMKDLDELMREEAEAIRERETRAGKGGAISKKNQPANVQDQVTFLAVLSMCHAPRGLILSSSLLVLRFFSLRALFKPI